LNKVKTENEELKQLVTQLKSANEELTQLTTQFKNTSEELSRINSQSKEVKEMERLKAAIEELELKNKELVHEYQQTSQPRIDIKTY